MSKAFKVEVKGTVAVAKVTAKKFGVAPLTAIKERFYGVTEAVTAGTETALEKWFGAVEEGPGTLLTFKTA